MGLIVGIRARPVSCLLPGGVVRIVNELLEQPHRHLPIAEQKRPGQGDLLQDVFRDPGRGIGSAPARLMTGPSRAVANASSLRVKLPAGISSIVMPTLLTCHWRPSAGCWEAGNHG